MTSWDIKMMACGLWVRCKCQHRTLDGQCNKPYDSTTHDMPECPQCMGIFLNSAGDMSIRYDRSVQRMVSMAHIMKDWIVNGCYMDQNETSDTNDNTCQCIKDDTGRCINDDNTCQCIKDGKVV